MRRLPIYYLPVAACALTFAQIAVPSLTSPAFAKTPMPASAATNSALQQRVDQIPAVLAGTMKLQDYFADSFLAAIPPSQFVALTADMRVQIGRPLRLISSKAYSPTTASAEIEFEKATATVELRTSDTAPYKVTEFLIKPPVMKSSATGSDSVSKIKSDFVALPGKAGFIIETLSDSGIQVNEGQSVDAQFAIGSSFKLYILAELASQIEAGERKWSDVVPLSNRSFSSTATRGWPKNTPMTLQTLATMMISVSDNSAADTLLAVLGRGAVEEKLATIGHGDPDKALPFLSTVEAFALKSKANAPLRDRFLKANEAGQRTLLSSEASKLGFEQVDPAAFANGPAFVDTIEWFASPRDIGALLNNIRRINNKTALDILGINAGVAPAAAAKWKYLGYKGGSEPGVMSMSFLGVTQKGEWKVISGSWNNLVKEVDEGAFATLMARLINLSAQ